MRCSHSIQSASLAPSAGTVAPVEPALDRGPQLGLAPEPDDERDVVELDVEPAAQLGEAPQEVELVAA